MKILLQFINTFIDRKNRKRIKITFTKITNREFVLSEEQSLHI